MLGYRRVYTRWRQLEPTFDLSLMLAFNGVLPALKYAGCEPYRVFFICIASYFALLLNECLFWLCSKVTFVYQFA